MRAALRGWNGIAIGMGEAFAVFRPCNSELDAPRFFGKVGFACER